MCVLPLGTSPAKVLLEDIDADQLPLSLGGTRATAIADTPWQKAWVAHMQALAKAAE